MSSLPSQKTPGDFPFMHEGQPDEFGEFKGSALAVQQDWDSRATYNQTQINEILAALTSTTLNLDGSTNIARNNTDGFGNNVQEAIDAIIAAGSGSIPPDNSVTNAKLFTDVKVGSLTNLITTDKTAVVPALNETRQAIPNKNYIINGNFDVWQRGTSDNNNFNGYCCEDRWYNTYSVSGRVTSQQSFTVGQTDVPNNPTYFSRTVVTSVVGPTAYVRKEYYIEDSTTLSGQTVTLSFYAKADSAKDIALSYAQVFGSGGSSTVQTHIDKKTLSTSWQEFTATFALPSVSGKTIVPGANDVLAITFWFDAGSSFNTLTDTLGQQSGTFDIAQVKLEDGDIRTPFIPRTFTEELQDCRRYYYQPDTSVVNNVIGMGFAISTTLAYISVPLPVQMFDAPSELNTGAFMTATDFDLFDPQTSTYITLTTVLINATNFLTTKDSAVIECTVAAGLTAGRQYYLVAKNANAGVYLSAEVVITI